MRLVDLFPRWIHLSMFTFLCPHCRRVFLTCKNIAMGRREQCDITEADPIGEQGRERGAVQARLRLEL